MGVCGRPYLVSALERAKESFLSPVKTGSQIRAICCPTPEGVGYGSYDGYAAGADASLR
jgi:hypothetical protein